MRVASLPGLDRPISRIVLGMSAAPEELPPLYDRFVELEESVAAADLELSPEQVDWLSTGRHG
jgi:hypothetical protein